MEDLANKNHQKKFDKKHIEKLYLDHKRGKLNKSSLQKSLDAEMGMTFKPFLTSVEKFEFQNDFYQRNEILLHKKNIFSDWYQKILKENFENNNNNKAKSYTPDQVEHIKNNIVQRLYKRDLEKILEKKSLYPDTEKEKFNYRDSLRNNHSHSISNVIVSEMSKKQNSHSLLRSTNMDMQSSRSKSKNSGNASTRNIEQLNLPYCNNNDNNSNSHLGNIGVKYSFKNVNLSSSVSNNNNNNNINNFTFNNKNLILKSSNSNVNNSQSNNLNMISKTDENNQSVITEIENNYHNNNHHSEDFPRQKLDNDIYNLKNNLMGQESAQFERKYQTLDNHKLSTGNNLNAFINDNINNNKNINNKKNKALLKHFLSSNSQNHGSSKENKNQIKNINNINSTKINPNTHTNNDNYKLSNNNNNNNKHEDYEYENKEYYHDQGNNLLLNQIYVASPQNLVSTKSTANNNYRVSSVSDNKNMSGSYIHNEFYDNYLNHNINNQGDIISSNFDTINNIQ